MLLVSQWISSCGPQLARLLKSSFGYWRNGWNTVIVTLFLARTSQLLTLYPNSRLLCICVYWVYVKARGWQDDFFIILHHIFWDRVFHWTWNFPFQLDYCPASPSVSALAVLGLQAWATMSCFYVCAGELHSGPHACTTATLPTEPAPEPHIVCS